MFDAEQAAPLAASEADVRRYLSTIAALDFAADVTRDTLQLALARLREQKLTIDSIRAQLTAAREEIRAARA